MYSKNAIAFAYDKQNHILDENRNGIGNEKKDGLIAGSYTIGTGIMLTGDDSINGSVSPDQSVNGATLQEVSGLRQ